jgi:DNA polymerase III subunit beta
MRLLCDSGDLAAALSVVTRAVSPRSSLPVLGMVLLEAAGEGLRLTATNLELAIRRTIDADVAAEGSVAVPGRLLADFTGAMPRQPLHVELDERETWLLLRSEAFETRVHGVPADEFPPALLADEGERLAIRAALLVDAITDTVVAASTDEARPVLTGVHLQVSGPGLVLVASDGYRLAVRALDLGASPALDEPGLIVPARTMAEVARLFRGAEGELVVTVSPSRNQVLFQGRGAEIASRVIDGRYPDHTRLVPAGSPTSATVVAAELARRLRALAPFAQSSANVVRLAVTPGSVVLSAAATEVGSARTEMEAAVTGPDTAVAFNLRYLLECPALSTDEQVELHLAGPLAPVVVRRPARDDSVYLLMPVRHAG